MPAPTIVKPIPNQVINCQAAFGPFNLTDFIQSDEGAKARFSAALADGNALPKGLIVTSDGVFTGIPAKGTEGNYEVVLTAENEAGSVSAKFVLTIKPSLIESDLAYFDQIKTQVWQALEKRLPVPNFAEFYNQNLTEMDIYYLLERWGTIAAWDAFNLEPPSDKVVLYLEGVSPHYVVYDRGSCIVGAPKDLYDHQRTVQDGLQTARAIAREVYKRNWTVELMGFEKFTRAAWIEIQHLVDKYGKSLEVINFKPSAEDIKIYADQAQEAKLTTGRELE